MSFFSFDELKNGTFARSPDGKLETNGVSSRHRSLTPNGVSEQHEAPTQNGAQKPKKQILLNAFDMSSKSEDVDGMTDCY